MKRKLPVYVIEGTDFIVDVEKLQLREKADPENRISVFEMKDVGDGYMFDYSRKVKNLPELFSDDQDITVVKIPELVKLDPVGMAKKYGLGVEEIKGRTDFDLMVDQDAFRQRLAGRLTTLDLAGHTFYVDIPMGRLRPKDDFPSGGIVFREIAGYYNDQQEAYVIPYNPKTREFQEPDYRQITAIPENLVVVSFPHESVMDPVGFNRKGGWEITYGLKGMNIRSHFNAKIIDWKETGIEAIIKENLKKMPRQNRQQQTEQSGKNKKRLRRRRGI
ncbi:MAG: hypothetical protein AB2L24_23605 [Mangrovibacterium sp.]